MQQYLFLMLLFCITGCWDSGFNFPQYNSTDEEGRVRQTLVMERRRFVYTVKNSDFFTFSREDILNYTILAVPFLNI